MLGIKPKTWTVKLRGKGTHTVEVVRKPWLAIGVINVDGKMRTMFPAKALSIPLFTREQGFEIDEVPCKLKIKPGPLKYNYDLYVNEKFVEPD